MIVTRNGWPTVQTKKKKYEKVSPKAAFPLKGIPATVNRDIYLQGLHIRSGESVDPVCVSIQASCS